MGPIEAIGLGSETAAVVVVGQTFITTLDMASALREGDYVAATQTDDGDVATLYVLDTPYVPGASLVTVIGPVDEVDPTTAVLSIGEARLDYSAQLVVDPQYAPIAGQIVEATGIQPVPGGDVFWEIQSQDTQTQDNRR
jgi:hypothetical protein